MVAEEKVVKASRDGPPRPWVARADLLGVLILMTIFLAWVTVIVVQQSRAGNGVEVGRGQGMTIDPRIDVNHASVGELGLLPGIGRKRADCMIRWRMEHGPFANLEQVCKATGLSLKRGESLRDLVTFGPVAVNPMKTE